ncbi:MAG: MBL fold metallo-hydrolase [Spirochaetaceae bacterium]|nr:MBL fold metallo-hydrolase [Spirochaetaceae bacterium]
MKNYNIKKIDESISYIPASMNPLSADVAFIKTENATWIFDAGSSDEAFDAISAVQGNKNIVLSHFHPDHTANITRLETDKLYLFMSNHTAKYFRNIIDGTHGGNVDNSNSGNNKPDVKIVDGTFKDESTSVKIYTIPSSHAKGCLCLVYKDYAFLGDATYCKEKNSSRVYNVQQLKAEISFIESLQCKYVCLSHDEKFVHEKLMILKLLKSIYYKRTENEPFISVDGFFR